MLAFDQVHQPDGSTKYVELFARAMRLASVNQVLAATAYATTGGAKALDQFCLNLNRNQWRAAQKRWLIGVDWCRTEPAAIEYLLSIPRSDVRIHAGQETVARTGCTPKIPFHPKTYILKGPGLLAVIAGSGNLSSNGMQRGIEVGTLALVSPPIGSADKAVLTVLRRTSKWFEKLWGRADAWSKVQGAYVAAYERQLRTPTPTDDDTGETDLMKSDKGRRAISSERLRQLRACRHLWIEAGNLHKNRGPGKPGNQLMLSPMTRVFFGFPARDLPPDSLVGHVTIAYKAAERSDCSLRFSNNSMDVLTLPVPGIEGPNKYDGQVLHFTRVRRRSSFIYELTVEASAQRNLWKAKSKLVEAAFRMTSGREWGVY